MTVVTYITPAATGGAAPVTVACTPASGTAVPVGTNTITCTATDANQRTSSCQFSVTVTARPPSPRLSVTRILAFGDSITAGVDGDVHQITPVPYPTGLQQMLSARYYDQTFTVINAGIGGEQVAQGKQRLPDVLAANHPDVVLLLEGANDLAFAFLTGQSKTVVPAAADTLRDMLKIVHQTGAEVFIATLTPERPNSPNGAGAGLVSSMNDMIRWNAERENAPLVDIFGAFGGSSDPYIGADGLHPNAAGYQKITNTFFDALRQRYETTAAPASARPH